MVKGTARQVVVVKSPDQKLFEQAIFLLRENALERGVGERELLEEARRIADKSLPHNPANKRRSFPPLFWLLVGAALIGIPWLITAIV
ncbi:MAG: hypothetical protein IJJ99_04010 [Oscillospiraceae bacterium]|nr:hypothetical protein [Oscillospiraceae bacterium]